MTETKRRLLLGKWRGDQEAGRDGDYLVDQLESVLVDVKYWLHRGLVMHELVSDPRVILKKVERVLP